MCSRRVEEQRDGFRRVDAATLRRCEKGYDYSRAYLANPSSRHANNAGISVSNQLAALKKSLRKLCHAGYGDKF